MKMITRNLTKYRATPYVAQGTPPEMVVAGDSVEYLATSASMASAKQAFADADIALPRNVYISVEPLETIKYGCTLDAFLSVAEPIA